MNNERYLDFLKFAIQRIIETATLYENQAKMCKCTKNKLYLYFLAGKKRVQHVAVEMLALKAICKPLPLFENSKISTMLPNPKVSLSNSSPEFILSYVHECAQKDMSLYLNLASLEEDSETKELLITLSKFTKDFMSDITDGYKKLIGKEENQSMVSVNVEAQSA